MKNIRVYLLLTCPQRALTPFWGKPRRRRERRQLLPRWLHTAFRGSRRCLASQKRNRRNPLLCSQPRRLRFLVYGRV